MHFCQYLESVDTTAEKLLDAAIASWPDHQPALILADYLEEHGDPNQADQIRKGRIDQYISTYYHEPVALSFNNFANGKFYYFLQPVSIYRFRSNSHPTRIGTAKPHTWGIFDGNLMEAGPNSYMPPRLRGKYWRIYAYYVQYPFRPTAHEKMIYLLNLLRDRRESLI